MILVPSGTEKVGYAGNQERIFYIPKYFTKTTVYYPSRRGVFYLTDLIAMLILYIKVVHLKYKGEYHGETAQKDYYNYTFSINRKNGKEIGCFQKKIEKVKKTG